MVSIRKYLKQRKAATHWSEQDQIMLDFYSQFISAGDLVFDIGANVGNRTKIFLKMKNKVLAVEPQDDCLEILHRFYGKNSDLTILDNVVGPNEGEAELMISDANTLSTLSQDWIQDVKNSGRFADYSWNGSKTTGMKTLDQLISKYGIPAFIKIDIEGFEYEALKGLTQPVNNISIEFTPECLKTTINCIDHLESLAQGAYNLSLDESMQFKLDDYVSAEKMKTILSDYQQDTSVFGDFYYKPLES
ncbi:MAG: FkbM family methyltransferase [Gammaproteobacteria bacterium]|nr:FkbM family methyltransferase [Gammaproteobacteria bacterium]MCP4088551.1 FkbM family methyltransferase [Gammaproteobacteria bacterium]MCP4276709.1 FkbM family methyltransferase [Gammaproteobacteria bacterium]MCP4832418.1 FkbM family methyltransferase [Gammaproteobacteria bacterium]MCP4929859.1 FkbM family methyltransferase [Gammaproteobacteria bacterium]